MQTSTRNEVKQLAKTIENLAQQIQQQLDAGTSILINANELARNSSTFVFTLGSMYAEELNTSKKTRAKTSGGISSHNFHNVRDSLGRFTRKV
jgi:hypothetical protein